MPELPDLQVFSTNLNNMLKGKTLHALHIPFAKRLNVTVAEARKALEGHKLKKVVRDGKELHFLFDNDNVLALHLMLHGELHVFDNRNEHKHTIVELLFANGKGLALTDWQSAATPALNPEAKEAPDALAASMTLTYLKQALETRAAVKNVLLDQKVIRGIGNAYADEILWDARISPFSTSGKIPPAGVKALFASIRKVLKDAEQQILAGHKDIISGEIRDFLTVHNPRKDKSPTGHAIAHRKAGGRTTYYTDEQQLYK